MSSGLSSVSSARGWRLALVAYAGWAGIAVVSLLADQEDWRRLLVGALLALFALVLVAWYPGSVGGRWNHLSLAVATAAVLGLRVLQPLNGGPLIFFFILSVGAVLRLPERLAVAWEAVFAITTFGSLLMIESTVDSLVNAVIYVSGFLFFGVFAGTLRRVEAERRRSEALLVELNDTNRQLQEYAMRVQELAAAEERNRLAREMHDTLGHSLTMAVVQLEGAQRLAPSDPTRAAHIVGVVRDELREGLAELRRSLATMRAPLEAELPLPQSLSRLAARVEAATHLPVHLDLPSSLPDLSPEHRLAVYRAAQEGLTNVHRHSRARQAWLTVTAGDGRLCLVVSDDGVGYPAALTLGGFGLRGLKERAEALGGELAIDERPGGGARLTFEIRVLEEALDDRAHD